ncbi:597_t:CDS:2, partial [Racocetra fulgida]
QKAHGAKPKWFTTLEQTILQNTTTLKAGAAWTTWPPTTAWTSFIYPLNQSTISKTINHGAYVDDTIWLAHSSNSMQNILNSATQFYN